MNGLQELAVRYHDITCNWNHTDGCGWYYEISNDIHDWSRDCHIMQLVRITKLMNKFTFTEIETAIEVMEELRH